MPLLEIAAAQPAFQNHPATLRSQTLLHGKVFSTSFAIGSENRLASSSKSLDIYRRIQFHDMPRGKLLIKAVATFEPKSFVGSEYECKGNSNSQLSTDSSSLPIELQSSSEDSGVLDEKERLRRMRISKANKGNTPWNKGRKHSPETLQRIKERTRLAMQNPKVKMKLINLGHAQSEETKLKIGVGVRIGWQRRREKLILQEMCFFDWQNLIAEASRRGYFGEDELQWDSYNTLKEQLGQEWMKSVEERKKMPRQKGSKRAPKSPEQRRKISEAISAKWANPDYRERVCSGLAKYHRIPEGAERKPRRRPSGSTRSTRRSSIKGKATEDNASKSESTSQNQRSRFRRSNAPLYRDPLASSKLEMIKNIRAQRATAETKKTEAIERARLLIAEAEKAAKALEVAATKSPIAQASLMETRKLIAEAIQSIESIETGLITKDVEKDDMGSGVEGLTNEADHRKVNGTKTLPQSDNENFGICKFTLQELLPDEEEVLPTISSAYGLLSLNYQGLTKKTGHLEPNGSIEGRKNPPPNGTRVHCIKQETSSKSVTKKWVCGRLVEVAE